MYRIELFKGRLKWYWRLVSAKNGQTVLTSQAYYSKASAKRSAKRLGDLNGYVLQVV